MRNLVSTRIAPCEKIAAGYLRERTRDVEAGLEKNENVSGPGGRKRTRGIVQDNEKKIAAKSDRRKTRWRGEGGRRRGRGGGPSMHRCARLSVCPSGRPTVQPSFRPSWTVGPWDQRMDGSQITCISDSLAEELGAARFKQCFSRRGNKLRS